MIKVTGHFGEFIQGILSDGSLGLISVPCSKYYVTLNDSLDTDEELSSEVSRIFKDIGAVPKCPMSITTNMVAGGGSGYSTALRMTIIQHAFGMLSQDEILQKLSACEKAIDPLFISHFERVLWRSRMASRACEVSSLPSMEICGGFYGEPELTNPEDMNFAPVEDLITQWNAATRIEEFAEISTESAKRTINLRGPKNDPIFELADEFNALGVVIAHTGSLRGLIFRPNETPNLLEKKLIVRGFQEPVTFSMGGQI